MQATTKSLKQAIELLKSEIKLRKCDIKILADRIKQDRQELDRNKECLSIAEEKLVRLTNNY